MLTQWLLSTCDGDRLQSPKPGGTWRLDLRQATVELGGARPRVERVDAQQLAGLSERGAQSERLRPLPETGSAGGRKLRDSRRLYCSRSGTRAEIGGAIMASSGVTVNAAGPANEAPEIPDNVGDWLRGVYRFATDRNDFRR